MAPKLKLGDVYQGHTYVGGDPNEKSNWVDVDKLAATGKTGEDFLNLIKETHPSIIPTIKALSEGRQALPTGRATTDPYWQTMLSLAHQYDPTLDQVDYGTRYATAKDFKAGQSAYNIRNLNQGIGHLSELVAAIPKVAGHEGLFGLARAINAGENTFKDWAGDPGIIAYEVPQTALASELAAIFKGKGASAEAEVQKFYNMLTMNRSAAQKREGAKALIKLLNSRLDELGQQYNQGMGTTKQGIDLLNPQAKKQFMQIMQLGGKTPEEVQSELGETGGEVAVDDKTKSILRRYGVKGY